MADDRKPVPAGGWPTQAELDNPNLGACRRMRPGCRELGPFKPFYSGYVCDNCLRADGADVLAGRNPPGDMGIGTLFEQAENRCRDPNCDGEAGHPGLHYQWIAE